jgi:hypothetical protein
MNELSRCSAEESRLLPPTLARVPGIVWLMWKDEYIPVLVEESFGSMLLLLHIVHQKYTLLIACLSTSNYHCMQACLRLPAERKVGDRVMMRKTLRVGETIVLAFYYLNQANATLALSTFLFSRCCSGILSMPQVVLSITHGIRVNSFILRTRQCMP